MEPQTQNINFFMFILKTAYDFAQLPPWNLNKLDDLQNISVLFHSRHSTEIRSEVSIVWDEATPWLFIDTVISFYLKEMQ